MMGEMFQCERHSMFRPLDEKETQVFRDCIYDDEKINDFMNYMSLCHPVTRQAVIDRIKGL